MKILFKTITPPLLILLFVYAAVSKLADIHEFKTQLYNQTFPHKVADILLYAIPALELLASSLLLFSRSLYAGLFLSAGLLFAFTGYISLVLLHFWSRVPCSCGGILSHMGWHTHLLFNCFFLAISLAALFPYLKAPSKT